MKCIMVMFDSLNRHFLPNYGCDWTHAPNFKRLARHAATFDTSYVCSMPCMPARRDLHTGRANFLHRAWGPLEPFDDSMPAMLKKAGVYTHLATDHYHYFEDGGATYHTKYNSWEFFRGQQGDVWMGQVADPKWPDGVGFQSRRGQFLRQDTINRTFMRSEEQHPQSRTFESGMDFIRRNHAEDNWFLQIETFSPHEPFFSHRKYKDLYPHDYRGPLFDWPDYGEVHETPEEVEHVRKEYAAVVSMCDSKLGDVLDMMDELDLWKDTMLVVWTDHGFLLGEHDQWAKVHLPFYEEVARTPFFVWDPRSGVSNERRKSLVQPSIDLPVTLLEFFGVPSTPRMQGRSLTATIATDQPVREAGMFGVFGAQVNVTDGRYVYMRGTADEGVGIHQYTLMPTHMAHPFTVEELRGAELSDPQPWARDLQLLKISRANPDPNGNQARPWKNSTAAQTLLFDLQTDPGQLHPIQDSAVEQRMIGLLVGLMRGNDAPVEQFARLGLAGGSAGGHAGGCPS